MGRGKYSVLKEGAVASFQSFVDVMVYPDKERAEFRGGGSSLIQVNTGDTGWVYDGDQDVIKVQTETQVANFKQAIRTSLDHLLRGHWKGTASSPISANVPRRSANETTRSGSPTPTAS